MFINLVPRVLLWETLVSAGHVIAWKFFSGVGAGEFTFMSFGPLAGFLSVAMLKNSKCWQFLSCLEFAILNSLYCDVVLKPKQVICLEKIFLNLDILTVLPTGYRKSLIFYLLPALLYAKKHGVPKRKEQVNISSIIVVVSPLNALMTN